jgi:hypothetical protein
VRAGYGALAEIFECTENFLRRLMIYTEIEQPTLAMTEVVIKIMAELMSVLALATEQVSQGRLSMSVLDNSCPIAQLLAENSGKKLQGEHEVEAVLQRLDRLTLEESRIVVALIPDVVYGLITNMVVTMEGTHSVCV